MPRIAICDDRPDQIEIIRSALLAYFSAHGEKAEFSVFDNPLLLMESLDKNGSFDIVLLDICMPGILGTDVARKIRMRRDQSVIIFLSSSDEYAVDAFALKAAHYLLKPFSQVQFDEAMDRAMAGFKAAEPKYLFLRSEAGGIHKLFIDDILYMESWGHAVRVYTKELMLQESRRSLSRMLEELEKLSPRQFISPYKGFIVNQKAILNIGREEIILRGGMSVPIPRRDYKHLQDRYMDYLFAQNRAGNGVTK